MTIDLIYPLQQYSASSSHRARRKNKRTPPNQPLKESFSLSDCSEDWNEISEILHGAWNWNENTFQEEITEARLRNRKIICFEPVQTEKYAAGKGG